MTETLGNGDDFDALPGLIRAEVANARAALDEIADDPVLAVHEARKAIKKARSNARLMRKADPRASKRANAAGRRAAHALGEARDADSLEQIARAAALKCESAQLAEVLRAEADRARADGARIDRVEAARQARVNLDEMEREAAAAGPFKAPDEAMRKGLSRTYKRVIERLDAAEAGPSGENLHELRKRVKDWRYHAAALKPVWPAGLKTRRKKVRKAESLLGEHHDLTRLLERLKAREGGALDAAIAELEKNRDRIAAKALKRARRAFATPQKKARKKLRKAA